MKTSEKRLAGFTLVEIMVVVVLVGLLASLAVPTFVRIRASSQDKAVLNNLRQLLFAADQYYLESATPRWRRPIWSEQGARITLKLSRLWLTKRMPSF